MASQEENRLIQSLIKHPDAMIVEVDFEDGSTDNIPFKCRGIKSAVEGNSETSEGLKAVYSIVQAFFGVSKSDAIRDMEEEFPKCLTCPTFPATLNPLLPPGKKPVAVVSVWSRNAIIHNVSMNKAPYTPSLN
jgi:hypothetical protein